MHYLWLSLAIVSEVIATSALNASQGMTRLWPTVLTFVGYSAAFYLLSMTLKTMNMSVAYAIWSGVGVALIALVGWLVFKQKLDAPALLGMGLIVSGVLVMNLFSKTATHGA